MANIITWISLAIISIVFILFVTELLKVRNANKLISSLLNADNIIDSFSGTKLEELGTAYVKTISIMVSNGTKTNTLSSYFFNDDNVSRAHKFNLRMLDSASGTLVGLGLLGTFLGLTIGIHGFDSSDSNNIQQSIHNLLGGMGTAFSTSLLGMFYSLVYTAFDKTMRNKLHRKLYSFTEILDDRFYIDDNSLQEINQAALVDKMMKAVQDELNSKLTYSNDSGENVTVLP